MKASKTQREAESTGPSSPMSQRILVFRLAGQVYGIPLAAVKEIVPMPLLSRPPGLPSVLAGFFNLGGTAIAVLRLDHLFAVPNQTPFLYTPLLVLQNFGFPLALMVEEVISIDAIRESSILSAPENSSFNACTEGVAATNEGHVIILSPKRILLETEQQSLAALAAVEQTRLAELGGGKP